MRVEGGSQGWGGGEETHTAPSERRNKDLEEGVSLHCSSRRMSLRERTASASVHVPVMLKGLWRQVLAGAECVRGRKQEWESGRPWGQPSECLRSTGGT